ncbi:18416_t:CDS:2, partial [Dentiscutata erythropus]
MEASLEMQMLDNFSELTEQLPENTIEQLLGVAHTHPGHTRIAKRFLCPNWDAIDAAKIQQAETDMEFLVPSQKKAGIFYTVNIEINTYTCLIGSSGAPCKYQDAVAAKYNIGLLNFFQSLTPNDYAHFA